jgi:lysyl-tRNA synthetase, class II
VPEVSLNFAGLAHIVRGTCMTSGPVGHLGRLGLRLLGHRFQLERLVRFNEKFLPEWRPRFLVYESQIGLPRAITRVLQAEGYLPRLGAQRFAHRVRSHSSILPGSAQPNAAG